MGCEWPFIDFLGQPLWEPVEPSAFLDFHESYPTADAPGLGHLIP